MTTELQTLRTQLRKKRRQISKFQQLQSEQKIINQLIRLAEFKTARKVGLYLDAFGEIRTQKIISTLFKYGKSVYLPKINPSTQKLVWIQVSAHQLSNQRLRQHQFGMPEPVHQRGINVENLDLLCLPLLACDYTGTRLGMGGGFYDRTLSQAKTKPFRLGLAHDFQLLDQPLVRQTWDQPLDGLLIPSKFLRFKR